MYIKSTGHGQEIIFLHGWGLNSAVWEHIVPTLNHHYRVTCVDLPGHGRSSPTVYLADLNGICHELHRLLGPRGEIILAGWSLGGLIAIAYALQYPKTVKHLLLIASTPKFVVSEGWRNAMQPDVLANFAKNLSLDYQTTLTRFLTLQVKSSVGAQSTLRRLRNALNQYPPHPTSLHAGLTLLRETDLRGQLQNLNCPVGIILGERDTLVPRGCGQDMLELINEGRCIMVSGAGHLPFLSHPHEFIDAVYNCLKDGNTSSFCGQTSVTPGL